MASRDEAEKWIKELCDRIDEVGVVKIAEKYLQFVFTDINTGWLIKFAKDGSVESCEETINKDLALASLAMESGTFIEMMDKVTSPFDIFAAGRMEIEGGAESLMELLPVLS